MTWTSRLSQNPIKIFEKFREIHNLVEIWRNSKFGNKEPTYSKHSAFMFTIITEVSCLQIQIAIIHTRILVALDFLFFLPLDCAGTPHKTLMLFLLFVSVALGRRT
jgi:hypothetical protein